MVFVTGGSGLIGSFLISALVARGQPVRALYRGSVPAGPQGVEWVEGDILDPLRLREVLQGVSHVIHCAGLVSYAPQDEPALVQVNAEGTANVVDACLEIPGIRLCQVSSVAALGGPPAESKGPAVLDETARWDLGAAHSAYATSKYLAELEVWRGIAEGLNAIMVNPSVVLGPADWTRSSTRLLRYAYQQHRFYTPGHINVVDVRDVVAQIVRLTLELPVQAERFVLSAGAIPLAELLGQAARCFGKRPPTTAVPAWAAELIWRAEHLRGWLTGSRPLITKDTARAGRRAVRYEAGKVTRVTGLPFRPIAETVAWCCAELQRNVMASGAVVVS